jgi:polyisoprenoid-binding protein YceI
MAPSAALSTAPKATPKAAPASPDPAAAAPTLVESRQVGTVRYQIIPEQSEARYRVREQLANLSLPNDAIGRTNQLNGTITILDDGSVDPAGSTIVVDLSTLESDRSQRDNFLRRNVLQTDRYPHATFVARTITGLSNPPPRSGEVAFQLIGALTIRDVTREVTWDVTGTVNGDQAAGLAVTSFPFAEFNLTQPRVPIVLSLEDNITLELDVTLERSSE